MRSQFFIFLSLSTFVALNGCKPLARQEPVNQAEMAISASGIQVVATKGKERGFCMLQSQVDGSDKDVELLTAEGSLSDKQIEKTLNSLGIWGTVKYIHARTYRCCWVGNNIRCSISSCTHHHYISPDRSF